MARGISNFICGFCMFSFADLFKNLLWCKHHNRITSVLRVDLTQFDHCVSKSKMHACFEIKLHFKKCKCHKNRMRREKIIANYDIGFFLNINN